MRKARRMRVVALIHQPQMLFGTPGFDRQSIINSTVALAKATRIFDVPVFLTTVETQTFSGNIWPQLRAVYPDRELIERCSMNCWDDRNFVAAIQAIHDGYEVYVAEDGCGDVSRLAHDNAMRREVQAGAKPVTGPFHAPQMAARLGAARYLRRHDGSGQEPLRRLQHRR
jgi:nicotinamidase-related amidase